MSGADRTFEVMEENERIIVQNEEGKGGEELLVQQQQEVWSWGAGTEGQLGTGKLQDERNPQFLASLSSFGPISFLSCGGAHVIALTPGIILNNIKLFWAFFLFFSIFLDFCQ